MPSTPTICALTSEMTRRSHPQQIALLDADASIVDKVLDLLGPEDTLAIIAPDEGATVTMKERITARSQFVADRVTVHVDLDEVRACHIAIVGRALSSQDVPVTISAIRPILTDGGFLSLSVLADRRNLLPTGNSLGPWEEHIIRRDLVLRNNPPVHVMHLRFSTAKNPVDCDALTPITRPSSVPLTRSMHIDSNGVIAAGALGAVAALTKLLRPRSAAWVLPAVAAVGTAAFFRDPERETPEDPAAIVAASDGRVLSVENITDDRFAEGHSEWLRIAVFLSVLDVHVNRSPVGGRVTKILCEEGGYANAATAAAEHNVAQYTVLDTPRGPVVTAQRTGLIARRIVNRARVGAELARGERFGLIRFGSRTDVYIPAGAATPLVIEKDRVVGGETLLARWN